MTMHQQTQAYKQAQRNLRRKRRGKRAVVCVGAYVLGILYFFPILYMALTGFKTEIQAIHPRLFFTPTLETYAKVFADGNLYGNLLNSCFQVVMTTLICMLLGVPAAFAIHFGRFKKDSTNGTLHLWFLTTILLPPVAILVPLFLTYNSLGLMHTRIGLLILYVGFHLPLVIWMVHSFLTDIPASLVEASQIDGCSRVQQILYVVLPLARMGIFSACMLVAVFVWNEFFLAFSLTTNQTATLPVYMSRFREQQGQFTAQLSASSTISVLPALLLGWMTQKSLVKGLTMGAVKG